MVDAPWTDEQVAHLMRWQECVGVHPYTCGGRDDHYGEHQSVAMLPTVNGLECPECGWLQTWAHDFSLRPVTMLGSDVVKSVKVISDVPTGDNRVPFPSTASFELTFRTESGWRELDRLFGTPWSERVAGRLRRRMFAAGVALRERFDAATLCGYCGGDGAWRNRTDYGTGWEDDGCVVCCYTGRAAWARGLERVWEWAAGAVFSTSTKVGP